MVLFWKPSCCFCKWGAGETRIFLYQIYSDFYLHSVPACVVLVPSSDIITIGRLGIYTPGKVTWVSSRASHLYLIPFQHCQEGKRLLQEFNLCSLYDISTLVIFLEWCEHKLLKQWHELRLQNTFTLMPESLLSEPVWWWQLVSLTSAQCPAFKQWGL